MSDSQKGSAAGVIWIVGVVGAVIVWVVGVVGGAIGAYASIEQVRMAYDEADEQRADRAEARQTELAAKEAESRRLLALSRPYLSLERDARIARASQVINWPLPANTLPVNERELAVRNYGTGPAIACLIEFRATAYIKANGEILDDYPADGEDPRSWEAADGRFTSPGLPLVDRSSLSLSSQNIMPGQDALIRGNPWFVQNESPRMRAAICICGYIVLRCSRLDGKTEEFKEYVTWDKTETDHPQTVRPSLGESPHAFFRFVGRTGEAEEDMANEPSIQFAMPKGSKGPVIRMDRPRPTFR